MSVMLFLFVGLLVCLAAWVSTCLYVCLTCLKNPQTSCGILVSLRGSVVNCLTRNPGVLGSSHTGSSGIFRGSVLGQDTSELQPSTGET